jgi:catalase
MPRPAPAAQPTRTDLEPSPALSIVLNGPGTFKGRTIGVLVSEGADADLLEALGAAAKAEGAMLKIVAPKIGGITDSAGTHWPADEKVDGGPSVLFDAIAIVPGEESVLDLVANPTAHELPQGRLHAREVHRARACGGATGGGCRSRRQARRRLLPPGRVRYGRSLCRGMFETSTLGARDERMMV